jgi:hypothetical protein
MLWDNADKQIDAIVHGFSHLSIRDKTPRTSSQDFSMDEQHSQSSNTSDARPPVETTFRAISNSLRHRDAAGFRAPLTHEYIGNPEEGVNHKLSITAASRILESMVLGNTERRIIRVLELISMHLSVRVTTEIRFKPYGPNISEPCFVITVRWLVTDSLTLHHVTRKHKFTFFTAHLDLASPGMRIDFTLTAMEKIRRTAGGMDTIHMNSSLWMTMQEHGLTNISRTSVIAIPSLSRQREEQRPLRRRLSYSPATNTQGAGTPTTPTPSSNEESSSSQERIPAEQNGYLSEMNDTQPMSSTPTTPLPGSRLNPIDLSVDGLSDEEMTDEDVMTQETL